MKPRSRPRKRTVSGNPDGATFANRTGGAGLRGTVAQAQSRAVHSITARGGDPRDVEITSLVPISGRHAHWPDVYPEVSPLLAGARSPRPANRALSPTDVGT